MIAREWLMQIKIIPEENKAFSWFLVWPSSTIRPPKLNSHPSKIYISVSHSRVQIALCVDLLNEYSIKTQYTTLYIRVSQNLCIATVLLCFDLEFKLQLQEALDGALPTDLEPSPAKKNCKKTTAWNNLSC